MAERSHAQSYDVDQTHSNEGGAAAVSKAEKQDKNIVIKTAHTIRDKVVGFTEDVKEKAHNLRHNDNTKKK